MLTAGAAPWQEFGFRNQPAKSCSLVCAGGVAQCTTAAINVKHEREKDPWGNVVGVPSAPTEVKGACNPIKSGFLT